MDLKPSRGISYSRMGSRLTERTSRIQDASSPCSNHIRRSTRLCSTVIRGIDNIAKFKTLTTISSIDHQNSLPAQVNQSLQQKRAIAKRINRNMKTGISKCTCEQLETEDTQSTLRSLRIHEVKDAKSATLQNFSEDGSGVLETCNAMLSNGTRRLIKQRPGCGSFYAPTISSMMRLIASRDAKKAIKSCSQGAGAGEKKCHLKKNISSSSSEIISSGCSHSISFPSRRDTMASKMYLEGESSASRMKSTSASSNRKLSGSLNTGVSTSTTLKASSTTNRSKINDALVVVKPLEHSKGGNTRGLPAKGNSHLSFREAMVAQVPATKIASLGASVNSSRSHDNELSATYHNVSRRKKFSRCNVPSRPTSSLALGSTLTLCDSSANTDAHSCNNPEGIVERPMILERIEHNQERTSEHMFESESSLSWGRHYYHDQHREMRMDIDNMSYEELLELVEKMGSVSTGLTDEALSKCLKRSIFKLSHSPFGITDYFENGHRCSICQEECTDGENIGALACEHWYHVFCIQQWLKQKNWCPICKATAYANS